MIANAEAYQQSLLLLSRCLTPAGFVASPTNADNYARVWARDGIISGLAALASGDAKLIEGMRQTLTTLSLHQGPHGEIPSNVTIDGSQVSYGRLSGRVDALLWYIIGVCAYIHSTNDADAKKIVRPGVERALFLAGCWEYNNRNLIYTPVAGNWADEYIQQGYVLADQLLYALALRSASEVFRTPEWQEKAVHLKEILTINYWPQAVPDDHSLIYHLHAYQHQVEQYGKSHYWLPSFSPGGYETYFDGLAHALALLTHLGNDGQRQQAESYIQSVAQQTGSALLPAFWPVIQPGHPNWNALQANHLYGEMKNQPYRYHNGGLWPVITGLYVLGLVRDGAQERAEQLTTAIHEANARGQDDSQWDFAEYHHGQTHQPLGTKYLAWNAAAGVLAHQAVSNGMIPWPLAY